MGDALSWVDLYLGKALSSVLRTQELNYCGVGCLVGKMFSSVFHSQRQFGWHIKTRLLVSFY